MAQTFSGCTTAYADQNDMIVRYDVRTLGQLLSDTNTQLTSAQVVASTVLGTLLLAGSGRLELATFAGARYTTLDLAALAGGQREVLKDIVCGLTFRRLMQRRPHVVSNIPDTVKEALELENQLRQGERVFGFLESADAGKTVERVSEDCGLSSVGSRWLGGCRDCPSDNLSEDAFGDRARC